MPKSLDRTNTELKELLMVSMIPHCIRTAGLYRCAGRHTPKDGLGGRPIPSHAPISTRTSSTYCFYLRRCFEMMTLISIIEYSVISIAFQTQISWLILPRMSLVSGAKMAKLCVPIPVYPFSGAQ